MNALLATAFILGIAGSAHCVGMCGPIALAVPSPAPGWRARLSSTLILNSGRLLTYMLLGVAFGAFGKALELAGLQRTTTIVAGTILLISVIVPGLFERWSPTGSIALFIGRMRSLLARNLKRTAPEALFLTGSLNGLLPCGLVYAAALGAATFGTVWQRALFMALFGLGTWPALIALRMSGSMLGTNARKMLRRASPVLVTTLAVLMILRGLELGIPLISPPPPTVAGTIINCH
ncbi:MAG: sulfite exporter TauE/SafE family protein [Flavobacteriales bacterium]|nr:sulfite exporter TauE/SafE family protein [Flavobacteriales bacterium]